MLLLMKTMMKLVRISLRITDDVKIQDGYQLWLKKSGYALGVLTPKTSPSGWVFSQAQHPMIKTYNNDRNWGINFYSIMMKLN